MAARKKYRFFLVLAIILLFCDSCALNRWVELSPIEPYIFEENGIYFGRTSYRDDNIFLSFDYPLLAEQSGNRRFGLNWNMYIRSGHNVDNFFLEGIALSIQDLDVTVSKQDLNYPLPSLPREIGDENYDFIVVEGNDIKKIYVDEIRDTVSEKLSIRGLYGKFRKVKTVRFTLQFRYTINGEEYNTAIMQNYNAKRRTSNARWDAWMGI